MKRVEVGRGDVNPNGIPVPNPHEQEEPDIASYCGDWWACPTCGENEVPRNFRCAPCRASIDNDRLERESSR